MNAKKLVTIALLIALEIILSRFLSIATPIVKIGFNFLPIALIAMLYGPVYAGLSAATADFLGAVLFPIGAYFPGFTLTAFLTGIVYGVFLHKHERNLARISIAVLMVTVVLNLGLNTLWLQMITGNGYLALFPTRILRCVIIAPIQFICIRLVASKPVYSRLTKL